MKKWRVIRVDEEVWAEIQRWAQPLEDTPNSALRRAFSLAGEKADGNAMDPRIKRLLELTLPLVGQMPQVYLGEEGYVFVSETQRVVAHITPQKQQIRVAVGKQIVEKAGLNNWDKQLQHALGDFAWYAPDGDEAAYQRLASVLAKLWTESEGSLNGLSSPQVMERANL